MCDQNIEQIMFPREAYCNAMSDFHSICSDMQKTLDAYVTENRLLRESYHENETRLETLCAALKSRLRYYMTENRELKAKLNTIEYWFNSSEQLMNLQPSDCRAVVHVPRNADLHICDSQITFGNKIVFREIYEQPRATLYNLTRNTFAYVPEQKSSKSSACLAIVKYTPDLFNDLITPCDTEVENQSDVETPCDTEVESQCDVETQCCKESCCKVWDISLTCPDSVCFKECDDALETLDVSENELKQQFDQANQEFRCALEFYANQFSDIVQHVDLNHDTIIDCMNNILEQCCDFNNYLETCDENAPDCIDNYNTFVTSLSDFMEHLTPVSGSEKFEACKTASCETPEQHNKSCEQSDDKVDEYDATPEQCNESCEQSDVCNKVLTDACETLEQRDESFEQCDACETLEQRNELQLDVSCKTFEQCDACETLEQRDVSPESYCSNPTEAFDEYTNAYTDTFDDLLRDYDNDVINGNTSNEYDPAFVNFEANEIIYVNSIDETKVNTCDTEATPETTVVSESDSEVAIVSEVTPETTNGSESNSEASVVSEVTLEASVVPESNSEVAIVSVSNNSFRFGARHCDSDDECEPDEQEEKPKQPLPKQKKRRFKAKKGGAPLGSIRGCNKRNNKIPRARKI